MTDTLTAEQIADIERIVSEEASGVTLYSDETDCLVWAALPALIATAKYTVGYAGECLELRERAEEAETEASGLRIQVEAMARIGAAREKQFAKAREARDAIQLCDDGSKVLLNSYAGGAHPDGAWSGLSLMFIQADGTQVIRRYVDATASEKAETEATRYRKAMKDLALLTEAWGLRSPELAAALALLKDDPDIAALLAESAS